MFLSVVGFYGFTTYVSIVNNYAPFSSPVSRLLTRGLAMLQTWHLPIPETAPSAISFHNRPPLPSQDQQTDADTPDEATPPSPSNNRVANLAQPHNPDAVPHSRSGTDPQTHVHILERLVTATEEAVENIPIFLELLDQPVKDLTLRPCSMEKWNELLHIAVRLIGDQSTFSVSAAWTLARTMMICYNYDTADRQLYLTLQNRLGSRETDDQTSRVPLNLLFSSYLSFWLRESDGPDLWRRVAFLEPSDAADAELLWMVNTSHWTMPGRFFFWKTFGKWVDTYLIFFTAVLTYISSTEQSRRSKVPLTFAVIYAMRAIRSIDQRGINPIEDSYILPVTVSTSEPTPMTFCRVDSIGALDLWSQDCIQSVKDLLQWDLGSSVLNDFRLSLIAALYIDSTKQANARSHFAALLNHTSITDRPLLYSGAYGDGRLAIYLYMAVFRKPVEYDHDPLAALYDIIRRTIYELSPLPLSGLRILEIAVKHLHKTAAPSSDWLERLKPYHYKFLPAINTPYFPYQVDHWIFLHLDTLVAPQPYLLLEKVEKLEWSNTPAKVHIAKARLDLYDSLADVVHKADKESKPDPGLLKVFLWSKDYGVCTRAFKWCLDLFPIGQSGTPGDVNSATAFIPETMGRMWVEHFIQVLCGEYWSLPLSWGFLISELVPKWTVLPSSWCRDFASALIFCTVPKGFHAYQFFADDRLSLDERQAVLSFLATLLELIGSRLTWASLASLENRLAQLPEGLENPVADTQIQHILATMKQQLVEETLGFFTELPMENEWLEESLEFFAELPMAGEWMDG